ncbi:phasin family protein [Pararhodobacter oceanensis]|uniref:Phasin domain-containing protein n=1 Tax=Pararhodobacter oceanensis TaxID=2172121 RepID=A0A2T8HPC9_9RHOB|nr:phasin family protein [Pararhodobacter oceanensis]PVH27289.1 hypothetical protein DDE20_18325 [Pararhodobacter oceanensis]
MGTPQKPNMKEIVGAPGVEAAMVSFTPAAAEAWLSIMSEATHFLKDRLEHDLNYQNEILTSKNLQELQQVQIKYFRSAVKQYSDYATLLSNGIAKGWEDTTESLRFSRSRNYDDIPL